MLVANLTEEQTKQVLMCFKRHHPHHLKQWIHPSLTYRDGTTDAVDEVIIDELEASVVSELRTALQPIVTSRVVFQRQGDWMTQQLMFEHRIPLDEVYSNPKLASQRDDSSSVSIAAARSAAARRPVRRASAPLSFCSPLFAHQRIEVVGVIFKHNQEFDSTPTAFPLARFFLPTYVRRSQSRRARGARRRR